MRITGGTWVPKLKGMVGGSFSRSWKKQREDRRESRVGPGRGDEEEVGQGNSREGQDLAALITLEEAEEERFLVPEFPNLGCSCMQKRDVRACLEEGADCGAFHICRFV